MLFAFSISASGQSAPIADFDCDTVSTNPCCLAFNDLSTNSPTSWTWSFPGGTPSSSITQNPASVCYFAAGTYNVTLIVSNAAGTDTIIKVVNTTTCDCDSAVGLTDIKKEIIKLDIFPNPATSELTVRSSESGDKKIELVEIYDVLGEKVKYLTPDPSPAGEGSASIDVSELAPGIYFVQVTCPASGGRDEQGNVSVRKLIKL